MTTRTSLLSGVSLLAAMVATVATADTMSDLEAAAKAEDALTLIALPHDWCGYGAVIDAFKARYPGLQVNELNPNAGSGVEIEAIKANKGNTGPQAPDVIDVGLGFGPSAKADGLLQAYKVSTLDDIPAEAKDADGFWYGNYYGVLAMGVTTDVIKTVPASFADLTKAEYAHSVALPGDPRTGNSSMMTVYAAGLSAVGKLAGGDGAADGGGVRGALLGHHRHRRHRCHGAASQPAQDRHDVSVLCPVPEPDGRGQRRLRAEGGGHGPRRNPGAGGRNAGDGRSGGVRGALSVPIVGRAATARGTGPRHRTAPKGAAAG